MRVEVVVAGTASLVATADQLRYTSMQAVQAVFRSPLLLVWACFNAVCTRRGCSPNSSNTND